MVFISNGIKLGALKRDLTIRFSLLLSIFLLVLIASYSFSSNVLSTKEYDSILQDIAGRQRMLIHQYASEINQVLVGLVTSDMQMVLAEKNKADKTAKLFEKTLNSFINGGEYDISIYAFPHSIDNDIGVELKEKKRLLILPAENKVILEHLKHVDTQWRELKRIALLSLRSNAQSISENRYVSQLLGQANETSIHMNHIVQLMLQQSRLNLKAVERILLTMIIIGLALFLLIVFYVYSKIILPLDNSVSELNDSTKNLEKEKAHAEKANQAKSDFLSCMSHELRTPMNAILGFAQMLKLDKDELSDIQQSNIEEILDAGYHLLELINEVLDLAKIESGKLELSMEKASVSEVLQQCLALIKPQAEACNIEVIDYISSKSHIVQADLTRLKQVLINLLSNAVKYNCNNGQIRLDSETIDKKRLRISITDTGEGLTEEGLSRLFMPFERLNVVHNIEGSGIGLSITKNLVELMGGTIGVESKPGEGSVFWVEFALFNAE